MRALLLIAGLVTAPEIARAEKTWTYQSTDPKDRAFGPVRFSPRFDFWVANFDRPSRACRSGNSVPVTFQFPDVSLPCNNEDSNEIGFGVGLDFAFRVWQFIYLTAGADFLYTEPDSPFIKNQIIIQLPFGFLLTYFPWVVRPIAYFNVTPVLYMTDDSRDYTVGGGGGIAVRISNFGGISVTGGYHVADTMSAGSVQLAIHPLF